MVSNNDEYRGSRVILVFIDCCIHYWALSSTVWISRESYGGVVTQELLVGPRRSGWTMTHMRYKRHTFAFHAPNGPNFLRQIDLECQTFCTEYIGLFHRACYIIRANILNKASVHNHCESTGASKSMHRTSIPSNWAALWASTAVYSSIQEDISTLIACDKYVYTLACYNLVLVTIGVMKSIIYNSERACFGLWNKDEWALGLRLVLVLEANE